MKKLFLGLIIGLSLLVLNCSMMPRMNSGYVITKDNQKIELGNSRLYDDDNCIYIYEKYSTHTFMKRDLKELYMNFNDKDYVFNH